MRGAAALIAIAAAAVACGKKDKAADAPTAEVTGLAAVPATAEAVIAIDVPRVGESPLIGRAIDQLLLRDPDLAARWQRLQASCKLDLAKQVKHVMLALGRKTGDAGNGPVLMIATGNLSETDVVACVRAMVGDGKGELSAKPLGARTLYEAKDGNHAMYFAFGRADTVVLGSNEAWVTEAIGTGKKALDNPELKQWIGLANQQLPVWGAGRIDAQVKQGLVKVTAGAVTQGPVAMIVGIDAGSGATFEAGAVMENSVEAKTLESFANTQKSLLGYAAQGKGLGTLVDKIQIAATDNIVRFKVALTTDEVNQLLSVLDGGTAAPQDAGP
jgi:hypothetical protein